MTATNHALTGAFIGLASGNPYIALPAAVLSHFACDSLPHFGAGEDSLRTSWFRNMLVIEAVVCALIVSFLALRHPAHWLLAAICAFLATSPDFMWIQSFRRAQTGRATAVVTPSLLLRFHAAIQWFERPIGAVFELAWAMAAVALIKLYIV